MNDYEQLALADLIGKVPAGKTRIVNGHTVERLDRETETYKVDGQEVCFIEAWDTVCEEA